MLSELQDRKLTRRFELMDADGDGFVDQADYEALAANLLENFPLADPVAAERLRTLYRSLWESLRARSDADGDGRVSRAEFVASIGRSVVGRGGGYARTIGPLTDVAVSLTDTDGDGRVSREEFRAWFERSGVSPDETQDAFDAADADGSGYLERTEVHRLLEDFYTSDDPGAPGNLVYGRY